MFCRPPAQIPVCGRLQETDSSKRGPPLFSARQLGTADPLLFDERPPAHGAFFLGAWLSLSRSAVRRGDQGPMTQQKQQVCDAARSNNTPRITFCQHSRCIWTASRSCRRTRPSRSPAGLVILESCSRIRGGSRRVFHAFLHSSRNNQSHEQPDWQPTA